MTLYIVEFACSEDGSIVVDGGKEGPKLSSDADELAKGLLRSETAIRGEQICTRLSFSSDVDVRASS